MDENKIAEAILGEKGKSRQDPKEGKTGTSLGSTGKKKQSDRKTFYAFTVFDYEEHYNDLLMELKNISRKGILGKEICPETKRKHLQGFMALKKPMRITELKYIRCNPHFEACIGNEEQNIKYCSKEKDYVKWGFPKPIKVIETLYKWQSDIECKYLQEPDDRTINWYYDATGNIGKSSFIKYMIVKHKVLYCSGGKHSDIMNLVFNQDMDECRGVFFDIPRANSGHISYSSLESIKNGMVCNTKYETGVKIFNSPHVFVFANFPPEDLESLSRDRWRITNLSDTPSAL